MLLRSPARVGQVARRGADITGIAVCCARAARLGQRARPKKSLLHLTLGKANGGDPLLDGGAMMLNTIEADAAIENCRALINQIDAGLSGEGSFGNIPSGAELLLLELHLERAASALERSLSRP
jgi:hypothetical protein